METRPLKREDLPAKRSAGTSMNIPVMLNDELHYICDIHFGDPELCWLKGGEGVPTKIADLLLVTDVKSDLDIYNEIEHLDSLSRNYMDKINKISRRRFELVKQLKERKAKG